MLKKYVELFSVFISVTDTVVNYKLITMAIWHGGVSLLQLRAQLESRHCQIRLGSAVHSVSTKGGGGWVVLVY